MHLDATDFASLDDAGRLAVLEAMVIGLLADDKVTPAEIRRFDEIVLALPWGVERDVLTSMITGARDRLLAVKTPAAFQDYLVSAASRLPSPVLRDKVVFTMATLMYSDGNIDQMEKNVLGMFVIAFGITSDRIAAIKAALHGAPPQAAPPTVTN